MSREQIKASSILPSDAVEWDQSQTVLGVGSGLAPNQLVIAGHSLGGYLATVFGRISMITSRPPLPLTLRARTEDLACSTTSHGFLAHARRISRRRQTDEPDWDLVVSAVPGHRGQNVVISRRTIRTARSRWQTRLRFTA